MTPMETPGAIHPGGKEAILENNGCVPPSARGTRRWRLRRYLQPHKKCPRCETTHARADFFRISTELRNEPKKLVIFNEYSEPGPIRAVLPVPPCSALAMSRHDRLGSMLGEVLAPPATRRIPKPRRAGCAPRRDRQTLTARDKIGPYPEPATQLILIPTVLASFRVAHRAYRGIPQRVRAPPRHAAGPQCESPGEPWFAGTIGRLVQRLAPEASAAERSHCTRGSSPSWRKCCLSGFRLVPVVANMSAISGEPCCGLLRPRHASRFCVPRRLHEALHALLAAGKAELEKCNSAR
jgi:hypothetical protein